MFSDILTATPERLDELLNICGTALLGDEVTGELQSVCKDQFLTVIIAEHDHYDVTFPLHLESLHPLQLADTTEKCRAENQIRHSDADADAVGKEDVVIHGGGGYAIYSSQDNLGEVGETYGRVLDAVGAWCGVTREDVLRVTEAFERRLVWNLERTWGNKALYSDD